MFIKSIKNSLMLAVLSAGFACSSVADEGASKGGEGASHSKWGEADTIGAANYLSAELALKAAALITDGKVYGLGIPVGADTPAVEPRKMAVNVFMPGQYGGVTYGSNKASYLDDMMTGWMGIGTQIDGLAHAGKDGVFYNNHKASDFVTPSGVKKLGVEGIPPIVTRGVLLDVARYRGVERLDEGDVISAKELKAVAKQQGVEIHQGDVVIIHTGWLSLLYEDPQRYAAGEPGLDSEAAEYLVSQNVVAVGMDNWGIDAVPFETDAFFDVHLTLLYKSGTYILETLDTRELAADKAYEFMFVLGQPRYVGAVQAMVNPIAIK